MYLDAVNRSVVGGGHMRYKDCSGHLFIVIVLPVMGWYPWDGIVLGFC